jgi:NAD+ kinase
MKSVYFVPKVGGAKVEESKAFVAYLKMRWQYNWLEIIENFDDIKPETIIIPCGGDGTVLWTAKLIAEEGLNNRIIGFNLGNVGFLTDMISTDEHVQNFINILRNDEFVEDLRTLLIVSGGPKEYIALNDFVVSNVYSDNMIRYDLHVGESYAGEHRANGVIVSTSTGSTAYAMSLGGAIIEPGLDVMEIIPIAAMSMTSRPIIVSGSNEIKIRVHKKENQIVSLKADGENCILYESREAEILIKRHARKVRMIHPTGWNFFERMTQKLNWNA